MAEAFAVVLEEFRDVTLQNSVVRESVGRQIHGVTGGQIREFAQRLRDAAPRALTEEQILAWADEHYTHTGEWPKVLSGIVQGTPEETWQRLHSALSEGSRGLPGGSSLAKLLAEHRDVRNRMDLQPLTFEQILEWVDAYSNRTGKWPKAESGPLKDVPGETWSAINVALKLGTRSLPGDSSLAKLLTEHRGVRNKGDLPSLTTEEILGWADAHYDHTGNWPTSKSGPISGAPGETWSAINAALGLGLRGLLAGSSLAKLFAEHRGSRNISELPPLTVEQILKWADTHHEQTGEWPKRDDGPVQPAPGETWQKINNALVCGLRGLSEISSLAKLLEEHRGVRNSKALVPLTIEQILAWADEHYKH